MNLDLNGMAGTAVVVPKAAGAITGTAMLYLHPRNSGAHSIGSPPSVDGRDRLCVPIVRVEDELVALGLPPDRVGLVWVDVEGHEPEVLDGLAGLVARAVPIAFEFTPSRYDGVTRQRLVDLLVGRCTTLYSLGRSTGAAPIQAPRRASKPTTYWSTDWSRAKERAFSHLRAALVFDLMSVSDRSKPNLRHARRRNR